MFLGVGYQFFIQILFLNIGFFSQFCSIYIFCGIGDRPVRLRGVKQIVYFLRICGLMYCSKKVKIISCVWGYRGDMPILYYVLGVSVFNFNRLQVVHIFLGFMRLYHGVPRLEVFFKVILGQLRISIRHMGVYQSLRRTVIACATACQTYGMYLIQGFEVYRGFNIKSQKILRATSCGVQSRKWFNKSFSL